VVHDARYDRFADWYPAWVGDGNGLNADGVGELLPASIQGARVLDVACGHGRASRALARLGADVLGVDISAELVAREHRRSRTSTRSESLDVDDLMARRGSRRSLQPT
jgi:2-polyprenyl-3-methyl-5-hydroxy-6-metoxy-1,4-benzoquinol methylase